MTPVLLATRAAAIAVETNIIAKNSKPLQKHRREEPILVAPEAVPYNSDEPQGR